MGAQNAKNDLETYRAGYPDEVDDPDAKENLRFYKGERASIPDGDYIDEIHKKWKGKYSLLERHHGYIQWLFPIREHGMNYQSQKLQKHELEAIKADPACIERVYRSYELMLDFYGIVLKDRQTGELQRADNYKERYRNLNTSSHNYLRITRILKCLGEMGLEHLKRPFLEFMIEEVYVNKELRNVRGSLPNYWSGTLRNDEERAKVLATIDQYEEKEREERMAAGGGRYGGGGYGDRYGAYGGGGPAGYRRTAANYDDSDSSDGMSDSSSSDDENMMMTAAERHKRHAIKKKVAAAGANAGNPGRTAAGDAMEEDEKEKPEKEQAGGGNEKAGEKEEPSAGGAEKSLDDSQRCCQANESQPTGDEGATATQELGNESELPVGADSQPKPDTHDVLG